CLGRVVTTLDLERGLIRAAVLGAAQRTDRASDARMDVRAGAGYHPRGERGSIELVLRVQDQRGMHRAHPRWRRLPTVQQVQEMAADRVVLRLHVNPLPVVAVVKPVREHRTEGGDQLVCDIARAGNVVVVLLRQYAT